MSDRDRISDCFIYSLDELSESLQYELSLENSQSSEIPENMHREDKRLETYTNWNNDSVDVNELARLGLYFLRHPDVVKCAFCDVELRNWKPGEEVLMKHFLSSSNCALLNRKDNNNVPIDMSKLDDVLIGASYWSNMAVNSNQPEVQGPVNIMYIQYESNEDRLDSYKDCASTSEQTPEELAEAGLFYSRLEDEVICYSCGGHIGDWKEVYNIWEIHAARFSHCDYVKFFHSEEFIRNAKIKHPEKSYSFQESVLDLPSTSNDTTQDTYYTPGASASNSQSTYEVFCERDYNTIATCEADVPLYLNYEKNRLETFNNWDVSFIDKHDLAMLGFYYTKLLDIVKCVFCGVIIRDWKIDDDILTIHTIASPQCPLLNLSAQTNVPLNPNTLDTIQDSTVQQSTYDQHSSVLTTEPSTQNPVQRDANAMSDSRTSAKPDNPSVGNQHSNKTCKICKDRVYNTIFSPCGHVYCWECASTNSNICPQCQENVTSITKLHFS